jgi:hypothetical protein
MMNEFRPIRSTADRSPDTDIEALMQTKPFEEPPTSNEELLVLREAVASIVDDLEPRDLWIINACISEGKSLQKIADELNMTKTHVWRLRNQAFEKLKVAMSANTTIRKSIRLADTWEQSAMQWVMYIAGLGSTEDSEPLDIERMRSYITALEAVYRTDREVMVRQETFTDIAVSAINEMRFAETWDTGEMVATLCRKQHDYGHGNINRFGMYGVVVRLSDKIERLDNLKNRNTKAFHESTNDTLMDIVGYCVIALMILDDTFNLELGDYDGNTGTHE